MSQTIIISYMGARNNLCILGLDRAGKSIIKNYFTTGTTDKTMRPTIAFDISKYSYKNLFYSLVDFPGQGPLRKSWPTQFKYSKILIFVIDVSDATRFEESKKEFDGILANELLKRVPIIVMFHKMDIPESKENLKKVKTLFNLLAVTDHSVFTFETSIKQPETLDEVKEMMMLTVRNLVMPD